MVVLLTFAVLMVLGAATKTTQHYSRLWFFTWMSASLLLLPLLRVLMLRWVHRALRSGSYVHSALSVGVGCEPLSAEVINSTSKGLVRVRNTLRLQAIAELSALHAQISQQAIDKVYIKVPWAHSPEASESLGDLRNLATDIFLIPEAQPISIDVIGVQQLAGNVSLQLMSRPIDGWNFWLKRSQDVTVAVLAIALLSPLLLIVALAIKLESRGPILFRQRRMGFNGQIFELWKFRSMYAELADAHAAVQTSKNDHRVTRVGRFIRRTSLDELPQLFNVLQGTMSIVGPRPHALQTTAEGKMLADAIDNYAVAPPRQAGHHRLGPGARAARRASHRRAVNATRSIRSRVHRSAGPCCSMRGSSS